MIECLVHRIFLGDRILEFSRFYNQLFLKFIFLPFGALGCLFGEIRLELTRYFSLFSKSDKHFEVADLLRYQITGEPWITGLPLASRRKIITQKTYAYGFSTLGAIHI